jgi:hypothetical protein
MRSGLREMDVEEFLAYETRSSRSEFLDKEWKKRGYLTAWLHLRLPFSMGFQHGIPTIDVRDDKETGAPRRMIFTRSHKCIEDDDTVKDQYKRDRETGRRRNPPTVCPPCLMIEWIHMEVIEGRMHWLEPIFDFDIGDPDRRIYIRASGLWNGYKPDRLDDEQKKEMHDAGISPKYGWKEKMDAAAQYVICLVDHDAPNKGVQIMREGPGLGDKIKVCISKEMRRNPRDRKLGDPTVNPYPIQFTYDERQDPAKKYDALRVELDLTQQILDLIDSEKPDISMLAGDYSPSTLRSQLERAALIELPWDQFFTREAEDILGAREEAEKQGRPASAAPRAQVAVPRGPAAPPPRAPLRSPGAPARASPPRPLGGPPARALPPPRPAPSPPPPKEELFACDAEGCSGVLRPTDAECPVCGLQYEVEAAAPPPPPPPPPLKRRSELGRVAAPAQTPVPATRGQVVGVRQPAAPLRPLPPVAVAPTPRPAPARDPIAPPPSRAAAPRPAPPRAAAPPPEPEPEADEPPVEGEDPGWGLFNDDDIPFISSERADRFGLFPSRRHRWERW